MVGLGLLVGAVLHEKASAQADTARARRDTIRRDTIRVPARPTLDSILRDSLARRDSLHPPRPQPRDSIKASFAQAPAPVPLEIGQTLIYDQAALAASGAVTLQDLLDRIPGVTGLRSGWIAAPMMPAYMGDIKRIRVFLDGVEFDSLDPRTDQTLDLTEFPLWTLEELRIERGPTEIRVYTRTWRVNRTTPYSRVDISTGDQQTNLYRGFFGKRWNKGEGLQLAAQQYGTTQPVRGAPSSDQLSLLGRLGWATGALSVDGFVLRTNRNRGTIFPQPIIGVTLFDTIQALVSNRTDAYFRVGYGDPDRGPWFQAMASSLVYTIQHENTGVPLTSGDTINADTTRSRTQYVLAGGLTVGPFRIDLGGRYFVGDSLKLITPSGRVEFVTGPLSVSAFAEGRSPDSIARAEVTGRLTPLPFVSFLGSVGRSKSGVGDSSATTNFLQGEAALRLFGLWFGGGLLYRDSLLLAPPIVFGSQYVAAKEGAATGIMGKIDGTIYRALRANLVGIRWNDSAGFYRPRYQARSEIYVATNWLSRFPSGNLGIVASFYDEYRSKTFFPIIQGSTTTVTTVPQTQIFNFRLEVRIVSAVLSYQFRNMLGRPYELVPGYLMPRLNQFYGVRWEFWN